MKYRRLKDISLLSIAQAGPKDCPEFNEEYRLLVYYMQDHKLAGMSYSKGDEMGCLLRWLEKRPKHMQWFIDNGFIKKVQEPLKLCPFCGGRCSLSTWNGVYYCVECNVCGVNNRVVIGHGTKQEAAEAWNKRHES